MNAAYIVIPILAVCVVTSLFILPVTITLELMVCQLLKWKWAHLLPVASGILLSIPIAWVSHPLYLSCDVPFIGGLRLSWISLAAGICLSILGTWLGFRIGKKA